MFVSEHKDKTDLVRIACSDLDAAIRSRSEIEQRKLRAYKAYEAWSDKVTGGGKLGESEGGRGEFGWSKLTIPMLFWIVETELPRIALGAPTLIATAKNPAAVPYQKAKTLRLQAQMQDADARPAIFRAAKRMSLYGLGPMVWYWNQDEARMQVEDVSWFDFFISPEARRWQEAEVLWIRAWYTERQLRRLEKREDKDGKPLFENIDEILTGSGDPTIEDPLWGERRQAHGAGTEVWPDDDGVYPLYTGWYRDGSVVILGGASHETLVQARATQYWRRIPFAARRRLEDGSIDPDATMMRPFRPIVCLSNTPDTEGPYPTGSGEVVINYQEELSTIRRQALDQATAHLNAPVIYDKAALGDNASAKIDAAFGAPGGKLGVNGGQDVNTVVRRFVPGQLSIDTQAMSELSRAEVQLVTGISDYVGGLMSQGGLGSNTTATAVQRITDESNMRWRFKNALVEDDMQEAARIVDACDKLFGQVMYWNTGGGDGAGDMAGMSGITNHDGLLELDIAFNGDAYEFDVKVEAGSLTPPSQSQEYQDIVKLIETAVNVPEMAAQVRWSEVIRNVVAALGFDPASVLLTDEETAAKLSAMQANPGETPVGTPQPVEAA